MTTQYEKAIAALDERYGASGCGRYPCPAHDGQDRNLSVSEGDDGKALVHCHSHGCDAREILAALDVGAPSKTSAPRKRRASKVGKPGKAKKTNGGERPRVTLGRLLSEWEKQGGVACVDARHEYQNADGSLSFLVGRLLGDDGAKSFRQAEAADDGRFYRTMAIDSRPLYLLPELLAADPAEPVLISEGEKCADVLAGLGFLSTTTSQGAGKSAKHDFAPLDGRSVAILADNDQPGRDHAAEVAQRCWAAGATSVRLVELPCDGVDDGYDIADFVAELTEQGGSDGEIRADIERLVDESKEVPRADTAEDEPDIEADDDGDDIEVPPLGSIDPKTGRRVLCTSMTVPTADSFLNECYAETGVRTLHAYAGDFFARSGNQYVPIEEQRIASEVMPWLDAAITVSVKDEQIIRKPFTANPATTRNAVDSIRTRAYTPSDKVLPHWIGPGEPPFPIDECVACRSSNLHLPTRTVWPATPKLFATSSLSFDYDANASEPTRWLEFLRNAFDEAEVRLVQQWIGYCLASDTSQQKMLLVVGPRRSGKGTIARVITEILGQANVAGPTVQSLAGPFGLHQLVGKSLAIVSDARFAGKDMSALTERLLCITGEDRIAVDRKHQQALTITLPTRFMMLTNELPRLPDASGALAGRFILLRMTRSHFGREDHDLTAKLLTELPGILGWALDGLDDLRAEGRFTIPQSSLDVAGELDAMSAPVAAFLRQRCDFDPDARVIVADLFTAFERWAEAMPELPTIDRQEFGRQLKAAVPFPLRVKQGTDGRRFYAGIRLRPAIEVAA